MIRSRTPWTAQENDTLARLYPGTATKEVAATMGRALNTVYQHAAALGLKKSPEFLASEKSGRIQRCRNDPRMTATQFKAGLVPWSKGRHYAPGGRCAETQFPPGHRPHTWVPIGSYRVSSDGVLERKFSDAPGAPHLRWRSVARIVWEAAHGPIPPKHIVVFKPGCKTLKLEEVTLDKVELISRADNARRNHPNTKHPELGRLVQLKGAITRQVNRITREHKERADQPHHQEHPAP